MLQSTTLMWICMLKSCVSSWSDSCLHACVCMRVCACVCLHVCVRVRVCVVGVKQEVIFSFMTNDMSHTPALGWRDNSVPGTLNPLNTHTHTHKRTHTHTHRRTQHVHTHTHTHTYPSCTQSNKHIYAHTRTQSRAHAHTPGHMCTHTNTQCVQMDEGGPQACSSDQTSG